jgi:hypothetical protein
MRQVWDIGDDLPVIHSMAPNTRMRVDFPTSERHPQFESGHCDHRIGEIHAPFGWGTRHFETASFGSGWHRFVCCVLQRKLRHIREREVLERDVGKIGQRFERDHVINIDLGLADFDKLDGWQNDVIGRV